MFKVTILIKLKLTKRLKERSETHSCLPIHDQLIEFSDPTKFYLNWLLSIFDYFFTPKIDFKPIHRSKEASGTHSYPPILDQHVKICNPTKFYLIWWTFYFIPLFDRKNRLKPDPEVQRTIRDPKLPTNSWSACQNL